VQQRGDLIELADGLRAWLRGDESNAADAAATVVLEVFVMAREVLRDKER
jgi:hypothetical protein